VPETEEKPVIAFAPPLDQTPTFPTMVLVGTLVTVSAPKTVKLAKSEPSIGAAHAGEAPQNAPTTANARTDNVLSDPVLQGLLAHLIMFFMPLSLNII
jgi:hypothetical protein